MTTAAHDTYPVTSDDDNPLGECGHNVLVFGPNGECYVCVPAYLLGLTIVPRHYVRVNGRLRPAECVSQEILAARGYYHDSASGTMQRAGV